MNRITDADESWSSFKHIGHFYLFIYFAINPLILILLKADTKVTLCDFPFSSLQDVWRSRSSICEVRRPEKTLQYPKNMEDIDLYFNLTSTGSYNGVFDAQDGEKRRTRIWGKHQHSWHASLPAVSHSVSVAQNDTQAINRRVWKIGSSVQCGSRWKVFATRHFC